MPNQRRSRPVRRSSGSGDVFIPVIIILLGITILSLLIAFVWQKWQDKYDPDYLYPDSRPSSSQSESSSEASEPSSSEESSSEPESSAVQFGQPVPESERVTSAYFNDAVFIGDSLTTGIQLYNILPDTTVLAAVGVGLENIYTQEVIGTEDSKQTILEAADAQQPAKIYVMLGINGLKGLGADKTVELYRDLVQHLKETHPDSIIYVQSFMPINEQKFEANYGYNLTNAEIDECNEKLMAMAGEEQVYYVDVASAIKDETGGLPEAEVFEKYIAYRYGLHADFLECRSTNCGNNITYLLDLLKENRITFQNMILTQDASMQRRMDAGLRKYMPELTIINFSAYKAKVAVAPKAETVVSDGSRAEGLEGLRYEKDIWGMWDIERYLTLLMGEIPRLSDDVNGYGPKGKDYIAHVDIPEKVEQAFLELKQVYGSMVREANPRFASSKAF